MSMKIKLVKPMAIGEEAKKPVGYELVVSDDRAERWIRMGLAVDPSGKIKPPPPEDVKPAKGKGKSIPDSDE